ncbi:alpha/beta-hydrolase [Laetiporus sulphureus 93-53]|uniref:Dipeptidyl-peptidase V n=1 Tax=Laetiporus sulphureus 93-53 TaxID=1314785 RepID=A0A165G9I4_9APHY|nr:alpha/beta-hydrolase [Laetiporus sulphureus 93-53]KZT10026.1 alpha/beta-hydrolase [Laetiporus sulphureus 93-53]
MDPLTAEEVVSADVISSLKLSEDGSRVVYCVSPHYKTGDNSVSALWIADTSKDNSARKLTSGAAHDHSPCFHPRLSEIYFLSDRAKAGDASHIYKLAGDATMESEPERVGALHVEQSVLSFSICSDGKYIAFIGPRHHETHEANDKPVGEIWRKNANFDGLFLLDLQDPKKPIRSLLPSGIHVFAFSWSAGSTSIVYRSTPHADAESMSRDPTTEAVVSIMEAESNIHHVYQHVRMPASATVWRERGDLVFLQNATQSVYISAFSLWTRSLDEPDPKRLAYGEADEALNILKLGGDHYAVTVAAGLQTRIDVFDSVHSSFTAYETSDGLSDLDIKRVQESRYAFAVLRSSAVAGEPPEIWFAETEIGKRGLVSRKLSSHNSWLFPDRAPISRAFYWQSSDGERVEGVISHPRGVEARNLPTVVVPHGGPTTRDTLELSFQDWSWRHFLASHGYLVLSPNYRGSIGRGDAFEKPANGKVGTLDWEDIRTMIEEGISQGMVDASRVGIAGFSQGGYLAAWGCTRPNSIFKTAVIGAGVADWGMLAATSDLPDIVAALGGGAPWTPGEPTYLRGSPIRDCRNVRIPLLLFHGKDDTRIPVTQSIAFLRGVEREAIGCPKPELVIYPGEEHTFRGRRNAEDVLKRLLHHLDTFL